MPQVRAACLDVRQIVSDMGTELGICDYPDVVGQFLPVGEGTSRAPASVAPAPAQPGQPVLTVQPFLYPLALVVPGVQHLCDNAIKDMVQRLPFWPVWQAQAKAVCQWLAKRGHRTFLQARLPAAAAATPAWKRDLERAPDRFAHWC